MSISKKQLEILDHAAHRAPSGLYCGGGKDMDVLVVIGFMEYAGRKSFVPDDYFRITAMGRDELKRQGKEPK